MANPLIASGGIEAFREPNLDVSEAFLRGLTSGEGARVGDADITTRRGGDVGVALGGEDGGRYSAGGGELESTTMS